MNETNPDMQVRTAPLSACSYRPVSSGLSIHNIGFGDGYSPHETSELHHVKNHRHRKHRIPINIPPHPTIPVLDGHHKIKAAFSKSSKSNKVPQSSPTPQDAELCQLQLRVEELESMLRQKERILDQKITTLNEMNLRAMSKKQGPPVSRKQSSSYKEKYHKVLAEIQALMNAADSVCAFKICSSKLGRLAEPSFKRN